MIKILSIGNSFSQDGHRYFHDIAETLGKDILTYNLYVGGCSFEMHWDYYVSNEAKYVFEKIESKLTRKPDFKAVEFDKEKAALVAPAIRMLLKKANAADSSIVTFCTNKEVMNFVKDEKSFYPVSSAYSPDHIVYCKPYALYIPELFRHSSSVQDGNSL